MQPLLGHASLPLPVAGVRGVRTPNGEVLDIAFEGGRIAGIRDHTPHDPLGPDELDMTGYLAMPPLAEPHAHLDKAGSAVAGQDDFDLRRAIDSWRTIERAADGGSFAERARAQVLRYLRSGVTAIRTHVDLLPGPDPLRGLRAVLRVRGEFEELVDIQIVALAEHGTGEHVIEDALALGADLVGGAPALAPDPTAETHRLVAIAARRGVGVDLHIDEATEGGMTLPILSRLVADWPAGRLRTASHCVRLATVDESQRLEAVELAAAAGVSVVSLPQTNLYLQGRGSGFPQVRAVAPARLLLDAGVLFAAGGDNVQDPFNPLGSSDPLETASLLVAAAHLSVDEAVRAVTEGARRVMGLDAGELSIGSRADLVAVHASSPAQALAERPASRFVIVGARLIAFTSTDFRSAEPRP